jgi:hypothetical protein
MNTIVNPAPANGMTAPNVGIAAAKPKPRGKHAALAAALLASGGLLVSGLGLAAGTAHAAPGPATQQQQISDGKIITPIPLGGGGGGGGGGGNGFGGGGNGFGGGGFKPKPPPFFGLPPFIPAPVPIFIPAAPPPPPPPPPPLPDWAPPGTQVVWDVTANAWGIWLNNQFIVL